MSGEPFAYVWFSCGGTGARATKDGLHATAFPSGISGVPAEVIEQLSPVVVYERSIRENSGGAGKFRGGCGQRLELGVRTNQTYSFSGLFDRIHHPAQGYSGGLPGRRGALRLSDGRQIEGKGTLRSNRTFALRSIFPAGAAITRQPNGTWRSSNRICARHHRCRIGSPGVRLWRLIRARADHRSRPARWSAEPRAGVFYPGQDRVHRCALAFRSARHRGGKLRRSQGRAPDGRCGGGHAGIERLPGVRYLALVPNARGLDRALECGVDSIAVFGSASETFSQRNINCSVAESLQRFAPVLARSKTAGLWVRGYISMAFVCPFEGEIPPAQTASLAQSLLAMDCDEVCLADTIGTAITAQVESVIETTLAAIPAERLALHMHDTYGNAVDNIDIGYTAGIRVFDSAAGGLGGCPFAPGAAGNLATERLIDHLDRRGIPHGVDIDRVRAATRTLLASPIE